MDAVVYSGVSVSKSAVMHGVPKSTLFDHVRGTVLPGARSGPPTLLSEEEEEDLVAFLVQSSEIGYAKTRLDTIAIVQKMLFRKGRMQPITNGWWSAFRKRHPILSLKSAATLSTARAKASSNKTIGKYFDLLQETLIENGLNDDPSLIFNMDESGFPLDPKPLKGVYVRGEKHPCSVSSGSKSQITVVACVSATGQCLPPMIVWARKTMTPNLAVGEVPGTVYGVSDKGWMDQHLFKLWFERHFLRYAPAVRPLLLLLDGHSSHYCPETIQLASEEDVILFALPPNTTHLTQPLDKGVFGPCKIHWRRVCHDFRVSHLGQVVNIYNFSKLFSKAWIESMTSVNITSGFKTTGIYPLNRNAVKLPLQGCSDASVKEKCHSQLLPVFTPRKRFFTEQQGHSPQSESSFLLESPIVDGGEYLSRDRQSSLTQVVNVIPRPYKNKPLKLKPDSFGRVLTSLECRNELEEKRKKKEADRLAKEQRKLLREQKKKEKAKSKRTGMCIVLYL